MKQAHSMKPERVPSTITDDERTPTPSWDPPSVGPIPGAATGALSSALRPLWSGTVELVVRNGEVSRVRTIGDPQPVGFINGLGI